MQNYATCGFDAFMTIVSFFLSKERRDGNFEKEK
jgi:hypothetical protein